MNLRPPTSAVSVDFAHAFLLMAVVASTKPRHVLELGFGAGYTCDAIMQALEWNGLGQLTVVDNWHDWEGKEPRTTLPFRRRGAQFICSEEHDFVCGATTELYDILVSDAAHDRAEQWLEEHLRIVRAGGTLFFHDIGPGSTFDNLKSIPGNLKQKRIPYILFDKSSRADEHCARGWLIAWKPQ